MNLKLFKKKKYLTIMVDHAVTINTGEIQDKTFLDNNVDRLIEWYSNNILKGQSNIEDKYFEPRELSNFIDKIAVWYELRYPDYEIDRMYEPYVKDGKNINKVMFQNNPYIKELLDGNDDVNALDWNDFYNKDVFINSLSWKELYHLKKPEYPVSVQLDSKNEISFLLNKDGTVAKANGLDDDKIKGMHIKDVLEVLKSKNLISMHNNLEKIIKDYEDRDYLSNEILNAAMHRIMERGGNVIGSRRGLLFAKEFGLDVNVPMEYGIDLNNPNLKEFINECIKSGGDINLVCHNDLSIQEIITMENKKGRYTLEEDELHQRLVDILDSQVDQEVVDEDIKQKRIERKLEKSKRM
ncbi:MAG: hypothetical protein IJ565_04150 [Bacilli bacterium]|nr:hypothetical protein [Bacilli bacterium]